MKYRPEIDGLRAVAVLPVILFHTGFPLFSGGYIGVDVFFVISGYLITNLIREEMAEGSWNLGRFYERRARRILPPLLVVVVACIPFAWMLMLPQDLNNFSRSISAVSVFASNVLFWLESGYFDRAGEFKPLLHTWSLAVEEQFYIVFPFILISLRRLSRIPLLVVLTFIFVLSLAIAQWCTVYAPAAGFYLLPSRAWELMLGALVALSGVEKSGGLNKGRNADVLGLVGLALIVGSVFSFDSMTPTPGIVTLLPTFGTALVLAAAHRGRLAGSILSAPPLVTIGLISYSAYLWHYPLIVFGHFADVSLSPVVFGLAVLAASLLLAGLTWALIERPLRNKQRTSLGVFVAIVGTMTIATNSFAGFDIFRAAGTDPRLTEAQNSLLQTAAKSPLRKKCHIMQGQFRAPEDSCRIFSDHPDVAVFGNSHGVELSYALALKLKSEGRGVMQFTFSACPPAYGRTIPDRPLCTKWTQEAVEYIAKDPEITTVVISYYTNSLNDYTSSNLQAPLSEEDAPVADSKPDAQWQSYSATAATFLAAGKKVILILQAPHLEDHVQKFIMETRTKADLEFFPGVSRQRWDASRLNITSKLSTLPAGVIVIDPAKTFCDATSCAAIMNGRALYFDEHHMSLSGAALIADQIIPLLPPAPSRSIQQSPSSPKGSPQGGSALSVDTTTQYPAGSLDQSQQVPAPPSPSKPKGTSTILLAPAGTADQSQQVPAPATPSPPK